MGAPGTILLVVILLIAVPASALAVTALERTTVSPSRAQGNGNAFDATLSSNGRYVVFMSYASNLVPGDTNGVSDVFLRDRVSGAVERVSVGAGGTQGDGASYYCSVSSDARFVAFVSESTNLVFGDTNSRSDVFVRDRFLNTTSRLSLSSGGVQGNDDCHSTRISADGRYVAFGSWASDLVVGDSNGKKDVFVRDRQTDVTERVSLTYLWGEANEDCERISMSADGRFVAFSSTASNLVAGDLNNSWDVFIRDRNPGGTTTRVSLSAGGLEGNESSLDPALSADGRYVAFSSIASNLVADTWSGYKDIYVRDQTLGSTMLVSRGVGAPANGDSNFPSISADGSMVGFESKANNLVLGDTNGFPDAFVAGTGGGAAERISLTPGGAQGNNESSDVRISADGRYVAFGSDASNLVTGDTNGATDGFVATRPVIASHLSRSPSPSSKTYRRKRGVVRFTLSATERDAIGIPVEGVKVHLQKYNSKKRTWKTYKTLITDATGVASVDFKAKSRSTTTYRWYVPATSDLTKAWTGKQKISVK
jgi:hypothetical protein